MATAGPRTLGVVSLATSLPYRFPDVDMLIERIWVYCRGLGLVASSYVKCTVKSE